MMTLADLRRKAKFLESEIDNILQRIKPKDFPGEAVNWADLMCTEISLVLSNAEPSWSAIVEEGQSIAVAQYLSEEMEKRGHSISITMEW